MLHDCVVFDCEVGLESAGNSCCVTLAIQQANTDVSRFTSG